MTIDRKAVPNIKDATSFDYILPPCETHICANGLPIWFVNSGSQEVMNIEFVFEAGSWNQGKNSVAISTAALLRNGTSKLSSLAINNTIEYYGASLKTSAGADYAAVAISGLSKHIGALLPLLYEILTDAQFPESEVEIYKTNTLQRLLVNLKKTDFIANRNIDELLFGFEHPYGTYSREQDIAAITREDLITFLKQWYRFNNCKVFISGKFDASIMQQFETLFGVERWNDGESTTVAEHPIVRSTDLKKRITLDEKNLQGSIRLALPFLERTHEDYVPMIIFNTLFGGYFGSRLMSNIREDKGYTYGIYSYMYNNKQLGVFAISTEAGKDVCEAAIQEVYNEMEILCNTLIDEEELQLVKNYVLGGLLGDLDGPFQIISRWKNLILNGFPKERFDKNIEIYKNISAAELQTIAKKYFKPEHFYELVVI
jgi:zinc protease